jgi:superfamily I DNA/RNA helicase
MTFLIADTFTDSLARLTGEEQKAVKTAAFDLQVNLAAPGNRFHKLDRARDRNFWSVRVSADLRIIVHRGEQSLLLCYVGHHDAAYRWAETRRMERHPTTGAAQIVEIRETVREIEVPRYVDGPATPRPAAPRPPLFAGLADAELLSYGVPTEWLADVRTATEDSLLALVDHLPGEAAEALLELATGGQPRRPAPVAAPEADPFAHPDAQRRFRVLENVDELEQALAEPWEKWIVFLHPAQRDIVERSYSGPARVGGSAGTGKTIVALHRAVNLARSNPEARVLLATFSDPLAAALHERLLKLAGHRPQLLERIEVHSMAAIGIRLHEANLGPVTLAPDDEVRQRLNGAAAGVPGLRFSPAYLWSEWRDVVDAWNVLQWEEYRDVVRLGRKTRLSEAQRAQLWSVFQPVRAGLEADGLLTRAALFFRLADHFTVRRHAPFAFCVIDEAQDMSMAELRFLASIGGNRPNALFFASDLGQRIFQVPFSWKSLGIDVRGRSHILRVNYRTSHQIRRQADRLLPPEVSDVDGNTDSRRGTVSVFNGPEPAIRLAGNPGEEVETMVAWLTERLAEGYGPHELGLFVRSEAELPRVARAVETAGLKSITLDGRRSGAHGAVSIGTMHLAKGLEFRGVLVAACDEDVLPLASRLESVGDDADLEEVYNTERHLLYVACTRARDRLLITGVEPGSEFLGDLGSQ